ncbi:MAG: hypothetical protein AB2694_20540, partial [Candidatus Thiodiazotropha sp.]
MAEFEDPTFEDDPYDAYDPDDDVDLPDAVMDLPPAEEQGLLAAGDNLQNLRDELRQAELVAQKRLVDAFYKEVSRAYKGLRLEGSVDYDQFGIDDDDKILYWTPGDKKIPITATRGGFRFLALSTLASKYGSGGVNAMRQSLGLTDYKSSMPRLSKMAAKTPQKAEETLPKNIEAVEMTELPGVANDVIQTTEDVETALKTIDDKPIDTAWVTQAKRELAGLGKAMTRVRDELANNLAKLSEGEGRKTEAE